MVGGRDRSRPSAAADRLVWDVGRRGASAGAFGGMPRDGLPSRKPFDRPREDPGSDAWHVRSFGLHPGHAIGASHACPNHDDAAMSRTSVSKVSRMSDLDAQPNSALARAGSPMKRETP